VRGRDIEQLEQIASSFPDRRTMLTDLTLDPAQRHAGPGRASVMRRIT
jgi:hypothetical protein